VADKVADEREKADEEAEADARTADEMGVPQDFKYLVTSIFEPRLFT
jgi:hypothetical protein